MQDPAHGVRIFEEELNSWRPPEKLKISKWVEKYRVLKEPSEIKGPMKLRYTPYMVPIIDCCLKKPVEKVVFCKPAQIAGTQGMASIVGYYSHQEPCSIMIVMADEETAAYISEFYIQNMYRSSPGLQYLINEEKFNKTEISLRNNAYIVMGWASSVARLASRPVRIIIFDEVDKPGYLIKTREAGPISLGIQRTESYYNRKIFILSTPTIESGNIWKELNSCSVIYDWHVACPYCGEYQPLRWSRDHCLGFEKGKYRSDKGKIRKVGQVVWKKGLEAGPKQIAKAGYQCGSCEKVWSTVQKNVAVERGKMVPRDPEPIRPVKVGFHVNRIYSLLGKSGELGKLTTEFIESRKSGDLEKLQGFINSSLAEPWIEVIKKSDKEDIKKAQTKLEKMEVPEEAVALTMFIDNQLHDKWYVVRAWAQNYDNWLIEWGRVPNFDELENKIRDSLYQVQGTDRVMGYWRIGIDTGGGGKYEDMGMTEEVYWWKLEMEEKGLNIWLTKGASTTIPDGVCKLGPPLKTMPSGKRIPGSLQVVSLDTVKLKDLFIAGIKNAIEQRPRAGYFYQGIENEYIDQITAEEKRKDLKGNVEWVQIRKENHLLDCEVGNIAMAHPLWPGGGVNLYYPDWKRTEVKEKVRGEKSKTTRRKRW